MDDPFSAERAAASDRMRVRDEYVRWPEMARAGFSGGAGTQPRGFRRVLFLGMGGSAAGGDIVASWLSPRSEFELVTIKGQAPVGDLKGTLAVACSASGETLETIEMLQAAVRKGATAVAVSAGGRLMDVAKSLGVPHIMMPGVLAPRYMLPFIIFSCLRVVNDGLGLECEEDAEDAFKGMDAEGARIGVGVATGENPAKQLARSILQKTPVVYGSESVRGAGIRFKDALNENSKRHAIFEGLPDAFHNEIEAWEDPDPSYAPIFLRHPSELSYDRARADAMVALLAEMGKAPIQVSGSGASGLAQLVTMVYRLDLASYYVAVGQGRDPFPTRLIDKIKRSGGTF